MHELLQTDITWIENEGPRWLHQGTNIWLLYDCYSRKSTSGPPIFDRPRNLTKMRQQG